MVGTLNLARQQDLTGPQEWKDSSATTVLMSMDNSGNFIITGGLTSNSTSASIIGSPSLGSTVANRINGSLVINGAFSGTWGSGISMLEIVGESPGRSGGIRLRSSDSSLQWQLYGATSDSATQPFSIGPFTNHGMRFVTNNNNNIGGYDNTGQWTIGSTSSTAAITHSANGNLRVSSRGIEAVYLGNSATDYSVVAYNAQPTTTNLQYSRPTTGPVSILQFQSGGFDFYGLVSAGPGNFSISSSNKIGGVTQLGAWTLGSTIGAAAHQFRSGGATVLSIKTGTLSNATLELDYNGGTSTWRVRNSANVFEIQDAGSGNIVATATGAGAWTFGAANGTQLHQFNGVARFETTGGTNQAVIVRSGASATFNDIQFYAANNVANTAKNRIIAEIVAAQDSGTTPVFQYYVGRDNNTVITTRPLFSWTNFTTERGRLDADGTWRNTAGTWSTLSDGRLKQNITNISDGLAVIIALRPVSYTWRNPSEHEGAPTTGFLAEEVATVKSEWVNESGLSPGSADLAFVDEDGKAKSLSVGGPGFQAYLVAAMKELKALHDALNADYQAYKAAHP